MLSTRLLGPTAALGVALGALGLLACPGALTCVDGLCRCATDSDCGHGVTCCDATYCADRTSDLRNCQGCGVVCSGDVAVDGGWSTYTDTKSN